MRALKKIAVFPLVIVLILSGLIVKAFIKLGSTFAGVATQLLAICALLALFNKMWLQLGIFGLIFAAMMGCLLVSAELQVWIDMCIDILNKI